MTNAVYSPVSGESPVLPEPPGPAAPGPVDAERVADLIRQLLAALGEDPEREGLAGTPARVAAWYRDFLSPDPSAALTCFTEKPLSGQLVVVDGMTVWALCEHHMLPMNLEVTVGYVPEGEVVGLSKFGRIAQRYAGRFQVQERFTRQVAEEISRVIGSEDVGVAVRGMHLCMSMRGVRMEPARTSTLQASGQFQADPALGQRFLTLAATQRRVA
jgi:GTP cyclohydrolase I